VTPDHDPLALLAEALRTLQGGFAELPAAETRLNGDAARAALLAAAHRLRDNFPYQHPLYVGQMLKPPDPVALMAYSLAMHLNPNNHALDGGRASSAMEKECVTALGHLFGWISPLGHLTSGGTMANLEALWVARELCPGKAIVASEQAHYTHGRVAGVLGTPFRSVACDALGRMDVGALERELAWGPVGTVVVTLGTTAAGAIDPLPAVLELQAKHGFRVHVDAAYGGYFTLARNLSPTARAAFDAIGQADSVVIDPHKHGLQPYGCGCVLFRDPSEGRFYKHDSPYTYFSSHELHLGEISLECSRAGAAAVALWTTMRMLPLEPGGEFAMGLEAGREAAQAMHSALAFHERFAPLHIPELDIVTWAVRAKAATDSSAAARTVFESAAREQLHLALAEFPRSMAESCGAIGEWNVESVTCLRSCCMKPAHREWMPEILRRLDRAAQVLTS
jgi:glutamate/tyrosine decarboxylase-like PLP-dependent enzyme